MRIKESTSKRVCLRTGVTGSPTKRSLITIRSQMTSRHFIRGSLLSLLYPLKKRRPRRLLRKKVVVRKARKKPKKRKARKVRERKARVVAVEMMAM
jgi:hypothetical protein